MGILSFWHKESGSSASKKAVAVPKAKSSLGVSPTSTPGSAGASPSTKPRTLSINTSLTPVPSITYLPEKRKEEIKACKEFLENSANKMGLKPDGKGKFTLTNPDFNIIRLQLAFLLIGAAQKIEAEKELKKIESINGEKISEKGIQLILKFKIVSFLDFYNVINTLLDAIAQEKEIPLKGEFNTGDIAGLGIICVELLSEKDEEFENLLISDVIGEHTLTSPLTASLPSCAPR